MGLLDDAAGALGSIAKAGGAGGAVTGTPKFIGDEPLTGAHDDVGGASGPDPDGSGKHNLLDTGIPVEFIHYGLVHADTDKKFLHKKFTPATAKAPPEGHAIMMRDALQREAILLHGFVSSCAVVLQEYLKDKGPLGDVGAAVGALMGGGPTESKPDPTQLDAIMDKIKSSADKIKGDTIKYKDIHDVGKELHQTRADFNAFCEQLNKYYLKPPSGDGPAGALNSAMSAIPSIPGVGNTIQVVQKFLFKMFDIYLAAYLELRRQHDEKQAAVEDSLMSHERNIERASHWMTIDAIKTNYETYALTYPVWFKKPPPPKDDGTGGEAGDPNNLLQPVMDKVNEAKKDVEEKVQDVKDKADEIKKDIYDFMGKNQDPEPTPGTAQMTAVFAVFKGDKKDSAAPPRPPTAADATINALNTMLSDIGGLPSFLNRPIQEVTAANIGLLEDVFKRLMLQEASAPIDNTLLLAAGRRYLTNMITGLGVGLISGMVPTGFQGFSAQDFISKEMNQFLGKYTEPILMLAIGDLAVALEQSRKKAEENKAQTMEVYLGRLPWLIALMFRNTFFPLWNLIAEKVFGSVGGPLKSVLKGANEKLNAVRDKVDDAQKMKDTATNTADAAKNTKVDTKTTKDDLTKPYEDAEKKAEDDAAKRKADRDAEEAKKKAIDDFVEGDMYKKKDEKFPVTARVADGEGLKVEAEEPSVLPDSAAPATTEAPASTATTPTPAAPQIPVPAGF